MKSTWEKIFEYASMPVHGTMSRKLRKGVYLQVNEGDELLLHRNVAADMDEIEESIAALNSAAAAKGITFVEGSLYNLEQADGENVNIHFMKKEQDA